MADEAHVSGRRGGAVNLCFHGIGAPRRPVEPGEDGYWVSEALFLAVLDAVADRPEVRISFDDGNASDVDVALPALVERGLTARFFVLAGRVGTPGSVDAEGLRTLVDAGMEIGSHGMHHRPWTEVTGGERDDELDGARHALARLAGRTVDTAACPLGRYDRHVLRDLRALGYRRVFTSDRRRSAPGAWLQHRHSIRRDDTPASVRAGVLERPSRLVRSRAAVRGKVKEWR